MFARRTCLPLPLITPLVSINNLSQLTYLFCPADYVPCALKLPSFSLLLFCVNCSHAASPIPWVPLSLDAPPPPPPRAPHHAWLQYTAHPHCPHFFSCPGASSRLVQEVQRRAYTCREGQHKQQQQQWVLVGGTRPLSPTTPARAGTPATPPTSITPCLPSSLSLPPSLDPSLPPFLASLSS
jgi:hypothetical protein